MEIIKSINENIEPIQLDKVEMVKLIVSKYKAITINEAITIHDLVPTWEKMIQEKEIELGLKVNLWNPMQLEKLENEFTRRYLT